MNKTVSITAYPFTEDSSQLFKKIAHLPWAIYLDSGQPYGQQGRFDIISADPSKIFTTQNQAFKAINDYHQSKKMANSSTLPFIGGLMGYWGYDLAWQLEDLPRNKNADVNMPDMAIGHYPWAIVVDHTCKEAWFVSQDASPRARIEWFEAQQPLDNQQAFALTKTLSSNMTYSCYQKRFSQVQSYLTEGDCYQINLAQRLSAPYVGQPFAAYQTLRQQNPACFGAYINTPYGEVLSFSPERFIACDQNGHVTTQPIKGTRPVLTNPSLDIAQQQALLNSEKDQAENLMIVDLLRNDLGKACQPGSIKVDKLFALETHGRVHHLVSTVHGQLKDNETAISLLTECFPGGSITGAPKKRAIEIIESLEPHRRSLYTGSIGYVSDCGQMDTNIAIRTMVCQDNTLYVWAGGGVVADSECDKEYQECFDKIQFVINGLASKTTKQTSTTTQPISA